MADCSYSRCIQQRRNIRRELQKWTKNMVYIVGLERIAEELMGRRKWKLYQDSMQRNYLQPLNNNIKNEKYQLDTKNDELDQQKPQPLDQVDIKLNSIRDDIKVEIVKEEDRTSEDLLQVEVKQEEEDIEEEAVQGPPEGDRLKDWSPQSKCYFCVDGKLAGHNNHGGLSPRQTDSDSSDSPSDVEIPTSLTPSPNVNNHHRNNMTALDASMAALAAVAALSGNTSGPQAPLPFYPPMGPMPPNWFHLTNLARSFHPAERMEEKPGEQPLDLSSKGGSNINIVDNKINVNMRLPTLDSKHIYKAKPRMSAVAGRRTYTEDELQAALRDIQSGKLGTRRAAVIYGIPRSTLRNKVYKLALERERESHLNSVVLNEEEAMDEEKELSGTEEEKAVEKVLERPLLSMGDLLRNMQNPEALKALLQKSNEGNDLYTGVEHSAIGPYIQNFLGGLIPGQKHLEEGGVPEVVKRMMAEEHMLNEQLKIQNNGNSEHNLTRPSPSNSVIMKNDKSKSESDMETEDSTSNVILKIPSFKPTSSKNGDTYRNSIDSGSLVSPPVTSESGSPPILPGKGMSLKDVKDVIAKSISQKFQQSPEPMRHSIIDMEYKRGGFTPPLGGGISVIKTQQDLNRSYSQPSQKPQQQQNSSSSSTSGGKGTRPKRGKYRNYDRDSLVEAVRAVQRGEMSVHRAGSYYGVPHSTLEYKVKERHLMRPRKRDPKPNPVDEKIASLKQNDIRNAAVSAEKLKTQQNIKPTQQKFPPTSPNGIKLPLYDTGLAPIGYSPAPFPFWPHPSFHHIPIDYARSATGAAFPTTPEQFYASQMMQKLQEESSRTNTNNTPNAAGSALPKSARQMAESLLDGTGSNAFLDGIIRSTLESGVPSNDDKKEDKNVAPENMSNKALLDQLCRNSRFTPKPSITESSSGDEEASTKKDSPLDFTGNNKEDNSDQEGSIIDNSETIELSNESNDSANCEGDEEKEKEVSIPSMQGRIYLKQELTKPENLKPENMVRYREVLQDVDRNGITEGSASESDAQD